MDTKAERGERLDERMKQLKMSDRHLSEDSGVDRATIAKARKGEASTGSYDRLERALADT